MNVKIALIFIIATVFLASVSLAQNVSIVSVTSDNPAASDKDIIIEARNKANAANFRQMGDWIKSTNSFKARPSNTIDMTNEILAVGFNAPANDGKEIAEMKLTITFSDGAVQTALMPSLKMAEAKFFRVYVLQLSADRSATLYLHQGRTGPGKAYSLAEINSSDIVTKQLARTDADLATVIAMLTVPETTDPAPSNATAKYIIQKDIGNLVYETFDKYQSGNTIDGEQGIYSGIDNYSVVVGKYESNSSLSIDLNAILNSPVNKVRPTRRGANNIYQVIVEYDNGMNTTQPAKRTQTYLWTSGNFIIVISPLSEAILDAYLAKYPSDLAVSLPIPSITAKYIIQKDIGVYKFIEFESTISPGVFDGETADYKLGSDTYRAYVANFYSVDTLNNRVKQLVTDGVFGEAITRITEGSNNLYYVNTGSNEALFWTNSNKLIVIELVGATNISSTSPAPAIASTVLGITGMAMKKLSGSDNVATAYLEKYPSDLVYPKTDAADIAEIALNIEKLKRVFDSGQKAADELATYYRSIDDVATAAKFENIAFRFQVLKFNADEIEMDLKNNIDEFESIKPVLQAYIDNVEIELKNIVKDILTPVQ